MRIVPDTNVLLAAFASRGLCEAVFQVCLEQHEIILSAHILEELKEHLAKKLKLPARQASEIVAFLREHASIVEPVHVVANACRDHNDLAVLGTAKAGNADILITGDKDLLVLKRFESTIILTPRQFHDRLH
jgi:putative PIN family toxin of toxin-antitoxin system